MYPTTQKRYYSPQFSAISAVSVRRLAWALEMNMGQAVEKIVCCLPAIIKPEKVCAACKDKTKCASCVFEFASDLPEEIAEMVI
jgi:hypothetical protein